MDSTLRRERLLADLQSLQTLRAASSVFGFAASGDPPDRYAITFQGRGLSRDPPSGRIVTVDQHQCELRLTLFYPRHPPDVRWLTPLLHPNVSFGGFIRLDDIGLPWDEEVGLDIVCERLWDVARLAYYDLEHATNPAARQWLQTQQQHALPSDARPLRDRLGRTNRNVIRYERHDGRRVLLPPVAEDAEILYIDENTPLPAWGAGRRGTAGDDRDVLYIED